MNIYFSGIGGVGIGPLAEIAADAGYQVQGSDRQDSTITNELRRRGISVEIGQSGDYLEACHQADPIDWLVYTSGLPEDHTELVRARQLGIKTTKRDELLNYIIQDKNLKLLAVAGTHGKTTTTGMLVWALEQLDIPVSYSVGSTLSFGPSGRFNPESEYFVYECDEFDRNFLHFQPELSLITSIDYDHPDTYPQESDYLDAFGQFGAQSRQLVAWQNQHGDLFTDHPDAWLIDQVLDFNLTGEHNRRNATLVLKALEKFNIAGDLYNAINSFPGTSRRFEKLGDNLYSDYGHHPVEIAATLQMAHELSEKVVLVYQPHQNIRQHELHDQYTNQFELADKIYWLPTYLSREDPELAILTPAELTKNITNRQNIVISETNDELWSNIQEHRDNGSLVLVMGAGSIDEWVRKQEDTKRVVCVLLVETSGDRLIMQQRDNKPGVYNPGMISAFGGSVEKDESNREAAVRELHEETNIKFSDTDLVYFKTIFQPLNDGTNRWVTYYTLKNVSLEGLEIYEGEGYKLIDPLDNQHENLTPPARKIVELYASMKR